MKKLKIYIFSLASVLLGGVVSQASPIVANATVEYDKYFIPQYNNLRFVDVAVVGSTSLTSYITLTNDGRVFTHGYGINGQLGNGANLSSPIPIEITNQFNLSSSDKIVQVAGGPSRGAFAVSSTGRLFSWGFNQNKQLGEIPNNPSTVNTPYEITALFTNLGVGEKIVEVAAGDQATIVRTNLNRFYSFGVNSNGKLSRFDATDGVAYGTPALLSVSLNQPFSLNNDEVFIDYGMFSSTGYIVTNKRLYSWGYGVGHIHGNGSTNDVFYVTSNSNVASLLGANTIKSASIGNNHGLLLTSNEEVYVWGQNGQRQLTNANGYTPSTVLTAPTNITSYFFDELTHYVGDEPYTILWSDVAILHEVSAMDGISTLKVRYDYGNESYYDLYSWGRNGNTSATNQIGYYFGLLGRGDAGASIGVPYSVGSFDSVRNNFDYNVNLINRGENSAILTSEGGLSFIGTNLYGALGNGLTGLQYSTDVDGDFNSYDYYYVMSFEYLSRNLLINYVDEITFPFTKETVATFYSNNSDWIIRELLVYYYGLAEPGNNGFYFWNNLDDQARSLFDKSVIDDISAAYFDYEVINYFVPWAFTLTELEDQDDQDRYWSRQWAYDILQYYVDVDVDYAPLSPEAIALVEAGTETILNQVRTVLANVEALEAKLIALRSTVDIYDEDDFNTSNFRLYEADILEILATYEALTDIEKLYFDVYNEYDLNFDYLYGYYEDLFYYYIDMFVEEYDEKLYEIWDLEDEFGYAALFANLDLIKTLLPQLNTLPELAREWFTDYNEYYEYYYYETYWYWIYLNDLLPLLEEGYDVYLQLEVIDDLDLDPMTKANADLIIKMFTDYLALSEDAQDLFDIDYIFDLFYEAFYFYIDPIETLFYDIDDVEYEEGNYGLFRIYTQIQQALAALEGLPAGVVFDEFTYYDEDYEEYWYWTYDYYLYLKDLQPLLTEGLAVYNQIVAIEATDLDGDLTDAQMAAITKMYTDYLALSEAARDLLDPEYVDWLNSLVLEALANRTTNLLLDIEAIEDEGGNIALFENYNGILAAIASYDALPAGSLAYLDEETTTYYNYLKSLVPTLTAGMGVFNQIQTINSGNLTNVSPSTIEDIVKMINDFNALTNNDAKNLLQPYVDDLRGLILGRVSGLITQQPATIADFEAAFNNTETKEAAVANLLSAWEHYQSLSPELRAQLDPTEVAHLEALYARYLELSKDSVDLIVLLLIILHLLSMTYFAFKKRDLLSPIVKA
jgi:alpha-tubulin suppressor-like RCC1 family protein